VDFSNDGQRINLEQWFLTFFCTMPPLNNCPMFQAPLNLKKLETQMYSLVIYWSNFSML